MARYEHLPIYKKAMEQAVYIQTVVRNFSRYNKYSIGSELRDLARKIVLLIIRANSCRSKTAALTELVETCEMLKASILLAKEVKAFNGFKSFQHASELIFILCRQSEGWLKSSRKRPNCQPSMTTDR
jgi:hypothetical protein